VANAIVHTKRITVLGKTYSVRKDITADVGISLDVTLDPAKTGTLTTRTDDNTGTLTMTGGHGITDGLRLDVYWATGSRLGMTVGTVATNSVPIDGGVGDNLPIATTAITAMVPSVENVTVIGDDLVGFVFDATTLKAGVAFTQAGGTAITAIRFQTEDNAGYSYFVGENGTNPAAGVTVGKVYMSHGDSTASRRVKGAILHD
jgi:hypothetical protein